MPTPRLEDAVLRQSLDAWREHECNVRAAARTLGIPEKTLQSRINVAKARGLHLSEGARGVVASAKLAPVEARGGWIKSYDDAGKHLGTTRWAPPEVVSIDSVADRVRAALEGIEPALVVDAPEAVMDGLCAVYPLMDAHIGMHAWGRETGAQDYDINLAAQDMRAALAKVMALTPPAAQAILILGGDTLHANDNQAETPKSKHSLDVDGRHMKVLDTAISIIAEMVERLAQKHGQVLVRTLRGNHDPESHLVLTFALSERYRENPRITVEKDPRDLFMFQWGKCGIFANHGDRMKFQQMFNLLATVCPFWSATPHRHYLSGHYHKERIDDIGGMRMETLRPFCPPDAYGAMWAGQRVMQSLTFDLNDGLVLRAYDPISRAA